MKPQREFTAAGVAASHCPELLASTVKQQDSQATLSARAVRLARLLPQHLASSCGAVPEVSVGALETLDSEALGERIGVLAGNCILQPVGAPDDPAARMVLSVSAPTVFTLLDRAFGGPGKLPSVLPESFPASAIPVLKRLQDALVQGLMSALQLPQALTCGVSDADYTALEAYAPGTQLTVLTITFTIPDVLPSEVLVAFPHDALEALLTGRDIGGTGGAQQPKRSPHDAPFAEMPLKLEARLVDMRISLRQLAGLSQDMVLPVAVSRKVPLTLGKVKIAEGNVGALEDRLALKITHSLVNPTANSAQSAALPGTDAASLGSVLPDGLNANQDTIA